MITVSEQILDFLTGIHGDRSDVASRKEKIFERAFSFAYKDMSNHTVAYTLSAKTYTDKDCTRCTNNKEKIKKVLREYVSANFLCLKEIATKEDFNIWHKKACDHFVAIKQSRCEVKGLIAEDKISHNEYIADLLCHKDKELSQIFTYGQAQKLINMMLKYLYIYNKCEGWNELDAIVEYFHVPIDRFVLGAVFNVEYYRGIPWSKIKTYQEYLDCQADIKNAIDQNPKYAKYKNTTAFMWELAEWPFK